MKKVFWTIFISPVILIFLFPSFGLYELMERSPKATEIWDDLVNALKSLNLSSTWSLEGVDAAFANTSIPISAIKIAPLGICKILSIEVKDILDKNDFRKSQRLRAFGKLNCDGDGRRCDGIEGCKFCIAVKKEDGSTFRSIDYGPNYCK